MWCWRQIFCFVQHGASQSVESPQNLALMNADRIENIPGLPGQCRPPGIPWVSLMLIPWKSQLLVWGCASARPEIGKVKTESEGYHASSAESSQGNCLGVLSKFLDSHDFQECGFIFLVPNFKQTGNWTIFIKNSVRTLKRKPLVRIQ